MSVSVWAELGVSAREIDACQQAFYPIPSSARIASTCARSSATSASRRERRSSRAGSGGGAGAGLATGAGRLALLDHRTRGDDDRGRVGHLAAEQMRVARLLLPRPALEPHDEIAVGQPLDRGVELLRAAEVVQPVRALAQLARGLRPAEQEDGEDGLLVGRMPRASSSRWRYFEARLPW